MSVPYLNPRYRPRHCYMTSWNIGQLTPVKQKVKNAYIVKNPLKKKITQTAEMCTFSCQSQPRAAMKGGAAMMPNVVLLSRIYGRAKDGLVHERWYIVDQCNLWITNTSVGLFRFRQTVIRPASTDKATNCTPLYTRHKTKVITNSSGLGAV